MKTDFRCAIGRVFLLALIALFHPGDSFGQTIQSIDFSVQGGSSVIEVTSDTALEYDSSENSEDKQIVLDFEDVLLGPLASRILDSSSFNSPVTLISPYLLEGGGARIVIQLREMISPVVNQNGNRIKVTISHSGAVGGGDDDEEESEEEEDDESEEDEDEDEGDDVPDEDDDEDEEDEEEEVVSGASQVRGDGDEIDTFLDNRRTKNFSGTPISLQVRDADIQDVLGLIAEASGFNIIVGPGVNGRLTLSLSNVPWDQALDVVLETLQLGAERNNNVLRILTLQNLTAQKRAELRAKEALEASAPRITRVFPISYADTNNLQTILRRFGRSSTTSPIGEVEIDQRTNSIIVQDISDNIERMAKIIEILDTQTPQVLIEAKVVEATESFSKAFNGNFGFSSINDEIGSFATSFNGSDPITALIDGGSGPTFADASGGGVSFGVSPIFSFLPGDLRLNAFIALSESENTLKVVSSPRTVVLNGETANIVSTEPVLFRTVTVSEGVPQVGVTQADATLSLTVTPTITNDEGVLMNLNLSRDVIEDIGADRGIGRREMNSRVLVQSGNTLVIGGIYTMTSTGLDAGVPFLRDIPVLGYFFKETRSQSRRTELFIFVTPKILNVKKAGLSG